MSRQDDIDAIVRLLPAASIGITEEVQRRNLAMRGDFSLAATRQRLEKQKEEVAPRNRRMKRAFQAAMREKLGEFHQDGMSPEEASRYFRLWLTTLEGQKWHQQHTSFLEPGPDS